MAILASHVLFARPIPACQSCMIRGRKRARVPCAVVESGTRPGDGPRVEPLSAPQALSDPVVRDSDECANGVAQRKGVLRSLTCSYRTASRGEIEEAQVALEALGGPIDFERLQGLWRLRHTTAPDVVPLMQARHASQPQVPFLPRLPAVTSVYQRFTSLEEGVAQNIITAGDGTLLAREAGATFVVNARFTREGPRTVGLRFEDARILGLKPTDLLTAALAPALLPRGWLNHRALLALREFCLQLPLPQALLGTDRRALGRYMLTYIDDDMLIGRAQAGGGVFVFDRAPDGEVLA